LLLAYHERMSADETPAISFTPEASERLHGVIESRGPTVVGLRLQIVGRAAGEFQHVLSLVEDARHVEGDVPVNVEGIDVYVEGRNADYLDGVTIHFQEKPTGESGLEFTNPNPLWRDDRELAIQEIFDAEINPAIASHGGIVHLLGVEDVTAYVELGGGCQGCGMADVTLKQGIAATIVERVEGVERVVDQTDHDAGQNPYYRPSKK
jgi:Fe/S biogenesis protein NfuA